MKHTDYSRIADNYDKNHLRHLIPKDELIDQMYTSNNQKLRVLDLACGTGNFIQQQMKYYFDYDIKWIGADKSKEMLKKAIEKELNAQFINCDAHFLPFENNSFDLVINRFAFHHFDDKHKALTEMYRVLKNDGILSIYNICYDYMKNPWIYEYFPNTLNIDKERFLSASELFKLLKKHNFNIKSEVNVKINEYSYDELIDEARNRDMSQLNLISETEYNEGLNKLISDSYSNENYIGDIAFLNFTCKK